jgi:ATP synthase subunit C
MTIYAAFISLAAGLSVGLSGLAAGFAVGVVGDAGVRGSAQQPRLYVGTFCLFRNDSYPYFCGGLGTVWADCCTHLEHYGKQGVLQLVF